MEDKNIFEKFFYKRVYLGETEKDGKVYKKFKKVHRFPIVKKVFSIALYIIAFLIILGILNFISNLMYAPKKALTP